MPKSIGLLIVLEVLCLHGSRRALFANLRVSVRRWRCSLCSSLPRITPHAIFEACLVWLLQNYVWAGNWIRQSCIHPLWTPTNYANKPTNTHMNTYPVLERNRSKSARRFLNKLPFKRWKWIKLFCLLFCGKRTVGLDAAIIYFVWFVWCVRWEFIYLIHHRITQTYT